MNSRERILSAINHIQPDKVPIDLGSSTVTGISAIAYNNLKRHLKIESRTRVFDVVQQLANVDMEVLDLLGVDALDINRVSTEGNDWYDVELSDGSKAQYPSWFRPVKIRRWLMVFNRYGWNGYFKKSSRRHIFRSDVFSMGEWIPSKS